MEAFGGTLRSKVNMAFSRNTNQRMVANSYSRETASCELPNHNISEPYTDPPSQSTMMTNGPRSASVSHQYIVDCII